VPLPKKISIVAKAVMPTNEVAVQASDDAKPLVAQAVKELQEVLGVPKGAKSMGQPTFRLSLELGGAEAAQLKDLPHADQAYAIKPAERSYFNPADKVGTMGFRVAEIPEPATTAILAMGGLGILMRRKPIQW